MAKEANIEVEGVVTKIIGYGNTEVLLDNGHTIIAKVSTRLRKYRIKILQGDRVMAAVSPYNLDLGIIQRRL